MQPRLTPEIMEALQRRGIGGIGGGTPMPAGQQVMAPNPWGGPTGQAPRTSPLQSPPQPVPAGPIPMGGPSGQQGQPQMPQMPGQQQMPGQGQQGAQVDPQTRDMTKALMQRLLKFL